MQKKGEKKTASSSRNKRYKFVCEQGYVDFGADYRDRIRSIKVKESERRRALRSKASLALKERNEAKSSRGEDPMGWDDLDVITFDPRSPKHELLQRALRKPPKSEVRAKVVARLETEFCRLYSRYRQRADRAKGRSSNYEVTERERAYGQRAGILCIQKSVTPRQVLEYWHHNIKHFGGKAATMTVPGLAFLSSAANIDTVACSVVPDPKAPGGARVVTAKVLTKPKAGNSFSDTSGLDVRIRSGLESAGHATQEYNDRYLLTVQKNAMALAAGRDIFIPKGAMRDMSRWVAENLYAED